MKEKTNSRTRNFACVVYPESAPKDWMCILAEQFIPALISPLHDKDINATGEDKKPHYHVIIMFDGVKTTEQASEIFEKIGGVGCEVVKSIRGYARYLCHLDNPGDKYVYETGQVRQLNGADYISIIGLPTDRYKAIAEMIDFCSDNDLYSYAALLEYSRLERFDWFRILCDSGTVVIKEYLKSRQWQAQQDAKKNACSLLDE